MWVPGRGQLSAPLQIFEGEGKVLSCGYQEGAGREQLSTPLQIFEGEGKDLCAILILKDLGTPFVVPSVFQYPDPQQYGNFLNNLSI
jgi:hypothetical protein